MVLGTRTLVWSLLQIPFLLHLAAAVKFPNCLPNEKCIRLKSCPHILDDIRQDQMSSEQKDLITRRQCNLDSRASSHVERIHVCCPEPGNVLPDVDTCRHSSPIARIYGGKVTQINRFAWMAMLLYNKEPEKKRPSVCAGSLINNRYVLTAAHCLVTRWMIKSATVVTSVRLGEWNTSSNPDCIRKLNGRTICSAPHLELNVEQRIVHKEYQIGSKNQQNDIALLRLDQPVRYTLGIRPICVTTPSGYYFQNPFPENTRFQIAGWGQTEKRLSSSVLLKSSIMGRKPEICFKRYGTWNKSQLCVGGMDGNDTCVGDSGSPLMATIVVGTKQFVYLAGITSFGPNPCGFRGWPGVFTRTAAFIDWIRLNLRP